MLQSLHTLFSRPPSETRTLYGAQRPAFARWILGWATRCSIAAWLLVGVGCQAQLIPNTDVEDSEENRKIVDFCETYRKAVERRNVSALLKLADERYYEDGGNIDSADDIDKTQLKAYLETKFSDANAIRYEIRYRRIGKGRDEKLFVDYTYSASYQIPTAEGEDVWRRTVAENRLELVPHKDSFLILSGM